MVETLEAVLGTANTIVWSWPAAFPLMVVLLLGTGIFLTLRLRFINLRGFRHAVNVVRGVYDDPNDPGDITHFQALTTALSATVGIGNIAGVALAIHYGGPGALFWMWITALLGMTTKFTECTLALEYRRTNPDGTVSGGPMYYIERGLGPKLKPLALFFAACAVISSFGSGNGVQANTMALQFRDDFGLPTWLTGGASALLIGLVIIGGIKRIGRVASRVMPAMAVLYITAAVLVLILNYDGIPSAFGAIFTGALQPTAAIGGFAGATWIYTMTWGVKRGLFSNEAGQGSAPIAHAAARTDEPVREGAVALLEPFVDTLVVCTLTGLMIVTTGVWTDKREAEIPVSAQSAILAVAEDCRLGVDGKPREECRIPAGSRFSIVEGRPLGFTLLVSDGLVEAPTFFRAQAPVEETVLVNAEGRLLDSRGKPLDGLRLRGRMLLNGAGLTAWALEKGLSPIFPFGAFIVTISVFLFALSTAIGWSYYGDRCAQYLFGERAVLPYKLVFILMHVTGAVLSLDLAWQFADTALGLMALPNLIAINALSGKVRRLTETYFAREHLPFDHGDGDR